MQQPTAAAVHVMCVSWGQCTWGTLQCTGMQAPTDMPRQQLRRRMPLITAQYHHFSSTQPTAT
jgi:hypothetical protein